MSKVTTYYCDRCGKSAKDQRDLKYFSAEIDSDIEMRKSGARTLLPSGEVCKECAEHMRKAVNRAWAT